MNAIRLGYPDVLLHEASAAAVARVLEAHDLEVEHVPLAPDACAAALGADEVDLFASAWLPLTDAALLSGGAMEPLGLLYRPSFVWCVATEGPSSIADLRGETGLDRRILVCSGPDAALARDAADAYRLEAAGYRIETVRETEAAAWAEAADHARIVPLRRPHELLHASGLRALEDPLAALGPEQEARLLLRRALRPQMDVDLLDELDELTLGNKVVGAMAHAMRNGGMSAEAAADAWQRGKLTPRA